MFLGRNSVSTRIWRNPKPDSDKIMMLPIPRIQRIFPGTKGAVEETEGERLRGESAACSKARRSQDLPPHVHVRRAESEMMVDLRTLEVMEGDLPKKVRADVRMWMRRHHDEIIDRWNLAQKGESFDPIEEC